MDGRHLARGAHGQHRGGAQRVPVRRRPHPPASGADGGPLRFGQGEEVQGEGRGVGHPDHQRNLPARGQEGEDHNNPPGVLRGGALQRRGDPDLGESRGSQGKHRHPVPPHAGHGDFSGDEVLRQRVGQGRLRGRGQVPSDTEEGRTTVHGEEHVSEQLADDEVGEVLRVAQEFRVRGGRAGQRHVQGRRWKPARLPHSRQEGSLPRSWNGRLGNRVRSGQNTGGVRERGRV